MTYEAIVGIVVALLVQGAKKIQSIPLNDGQMARLRVAAGVLSFVGTAVMAYSTGSLADEGMWKTGADGLITYLVSSGFYSGVLKKPV